MEAESTLDDVPEGKQKATMRRKTNGNLLTSDVLIRMCQKFLFSGNRMEKGRGENAEAQEREASGS
uniref:Uncharacterized protein n=1 Tax=Aegilops tauschii subsp. strangulata TaxID=200361 RepID=A0A453CPP3_AEGTS